MSAFSYIACGFYVCIYRYVITEMRNFSFTSYETVKRSEKYETVIFLTFHNVTSIVVCHFAIALTFGSSFSVRNRNYLRRYRKSRLRRLLAVFNSTRAIHATGFILARVIVQGIRFLPAKSPRFFFPPLSHLPRRQITPPALIVQKILSVIAAIIGALDEERRSSKQSPNENWSTNTFSYLIPIWRYYLLDE